MLVVVIGKFNRLVMLFSRDRQFILPATLCRDVEAHVCSSICASQKFFNEPLAIQSRASAVENDQTCLVKGKIYCLAVCARSI